MTVWLSLFPRHYSSILFLRHVQLHVPLNAIEYQYLPVPPGQIDMHYNSVSMYADRIAE